MNKLGKVLSLVLSLGVGVTAAPAVFAQQLDEHALKTHLSAPACPLYQTVRSELETYYKRTDFTDPSHQSGWYRVADFLAWLKQNENWLSRDKVNVIVGDQFTLCEGLVPLKKKGVSATPSPLAGAFVQLARAHLAQRYLAGQWTSADKQKPVSFAIGSQGEVSAALPEGVIIIQSESVPFVEDFNTGLHEAMHLLPRILNDRGQSLLNEMATAYAQLAWALPSKSRERSICSDGARNYLNLHRQVPQCKTLLTEYVNTLFAQVLWPRLNKQSVLTLRAEQRRLVVSELLFDLAAIDRGVYYDTASPDLEGKLFLSETDLRLALETMYADRLPHGTLPAPEQGLYPLSKTKGGDAVLLYKASIGGAGSFLWGYADGFFPQTLEQYANWLMVPVDMQPQVKAFLNRLMLELRAQKGPGRVPEAVLPRGLASGILQVEDVSNRDRFFEFAHPVYLPAVTRALEGFVSPLPPVPEGYL